MKISVDQDDNFFYHEIELTRDEIRALYMGSVLEQHFQYDIIGQKDLYVSITNNIDEEED